MERKLASVQIVSDLRPIPEADLIEVATVKGWNLVVKKGEYQIGDKAIYCEIDSFLPIKEQFEFLRKSSYKKMGEQEGFRLKTIKLKGQVSQGLLLPLSVIENSTDLKEGDDVTELIGIIKFEPPIPAQLAGTAKGYFPSFIPKTDEERIQNLSDSYEVYKESQFYVTEKLDGSSATFYFNDGVFGVCSRNIDLLETSDNTFWKVARESDIENKLKSLGNFAIQGEMIGEGIQGNPYRLKGQRVMFYNGYNIDAQTYVDFAQFQEVINSMGFNTVPIIEKEFTLPDTIEDLLNYAEGQSTLAQCEREGYVIRSHSRTISFKVISNKFLLKEK